MRRPRRTKGNLVGAEYRRFQAVGLEMHQRLVARRQYEATAVVDGASYSALSRNGAPFSLARVLRRAGVADQPLRVVTEGLPAFIGYRSLHAMAGRWVEETAATPIRSIAFVARPEVGEEIEGEADDPVDVETSIGGWEDADHLPTVTHFKRVKLAQDAVNTPPASQEMPLRILRRSFGSPTQLPTRLPRLPRYGVARSAAKTSSRSGSGNSFAPPDAACEPTAPEHAGRAINAGCGPGWPEPLLRQQLQHYYGPRCQIRQRVFAVNAWMGQISDEAGSR
jgi:hypothetical protein